MPTATPTAKPESARARRTREAEERRAAIVALGWEPEGNGGDRYAASTGELLAWSRESVAVQS